MGWMLGGLGVWECKAPTQAGKQQGLGCPAREQHWAGLGLHPWVISMEGQLLMGSCALDLEINPVEEQLLIGSCALDLETSPLCFRYHFICFSTPGWGSGNSPFFNLWAFSIADQALQRQKLHPQSGCLLCRVHSPWLSYLVKSHFSLGGTRGSVTSLTLCCCGVGTTPSHLICKLPGMNVSDAACDPAPQKTPNSWCGEY